MLPTVAGKNADAGSNSWWAHLASPGPLNAFVARTGARAVLVLHSSDSVV